MTAPGPSGGVQSVSRALDLLEVVAQAGGQMAISDMATKILSRHSKGSGAPWSPPS